MSGSVPIFLLDGVLNIAEHHGVYRVTGYHLSHDSHPVPSVELLIPADALGDIADALLLTSAGVNPTIASDENGADSAHPNGAPARPS